MRIKIAALAIGLLIGFNSFAQREKEDCLGTWSLLVGNHRLSDKVSIPTINLIRNYKLFNHYEFMFFRTGITYSFTPKIAGTVGYAYLDAQPFTNSPEAIGSHQHWLYEEISIKSKFRKLSVSNRVRIEHRWINKAHNTNLVHRIRHRFQLTHPINEKIYTKFFNEFFVNFQDSFFNQNRIYLGAGYIFSPKIKVDVGYLKNHFSTVNHDRIRLALYFKTDFRKKSN